MTTLPIKLSDRAILRIEGPDRHKLLQSLITNDLGQICESKLLYAALLNPQGKYLFDFIIYERHKSLYLDCEKKRVADLSRRLMMYKLRAGVVIIPEDDVVALAVADDDKQLESLKEKAVAYGPDPRHPALGWRVLVHSDALEGLELADPAEYERLRLRLGLPNASEDFEVDKTLILEGNLDELNGVSFTKGCYVGQELTARTKHRGKVRKRLLPVSVSGPLPPHGTEITSGDKVIGDIRSGLEDRAIAYLRMEDITFGGEYTCGDSRITVIKPDWWQESADD